MKELSSVEHPLVKHLIKLKKNRNYRYECKSILLEGKKLISEVCLENTPSAFLITNPAEIPPYISPQKTYHVSDAIIKKISELETSEGWIAEVPMPKEASLENCHFILALDKVADPGNLGALLRSALAFGWEGVFLLEDSCDLFNDKALRAAKGATFKLSFAHGNWEKLDHLIKKNKLRPFAADLDGQTPEQINPEKGMLLILGNEANGISKEAEKRCEKVTIPMAKSMESLNVAIAGSILMYVFKP